MEKTSILKNKIIFTLVFSLFVISIQIAHAEPEFSFKFGATGTGNSKLSSPTDVALDKNERNIYVADSINNRINVFNYNGNVDFRFGTFCDIASIQKCNDNADGADKNGDGQFDNPISIITDALGKLFVIDSDNDRIQVFDDTGKFKSKFGSSNNRLDEYLGSAKGIAIQKSTKNIMVSNIENDSISVFDSTEKFLDKFDSFDGNEKFKNPTNMIVDNSNQILFVSDTGNDRIIMFKLVNSNTCPTGTTESVDGVCFVEEFGRKGTGDGQFDEPTGLAYDSSRDFLYVSDTYNDRIQIFQIIDGSTCPTNTDEIVNGVCFVEEFGRKGSSNGQFDSPRGITLDKNNKFLYVADTGNDRIQVFETTSSKSSSGLPDRPTNLQTYPISPTSILISWVEPQMKNSVPEITGYKIEYRVASGDYTTITENTSSKSTSLIHQGLNPKERYAYRVYSINSEGYSFASSNVTEKPAHTETPVGLTATAIAPSQIKLTWFPPSMTFGQSVNGYEIKHEIAQGIYNTVGSVNGGTTSFIVTNLETNKMYTYAVSAKMGHGSTTAESPPASATPRKDSVNSTRDPVSSTAIEMTKPSPPIKLTAAVVSATQVNLSWGVPVKDGNSPITGYKIEVKKDSGQYIDIVEDTGSTARTYSHVKLTADTKYTYKVSAINDIGTSDVSNESSVTPKSINIKIKPISKLTADEGKQLLYTVKLVDSSVSNVLFSLDNPPKGAKIASKTGVFSWTPTSSDGGKTHTLDVVVKKNSQTDRTTLTIKVNDNITESQSESKPEPKEQEPKFKPEPKEQEPEKPKKLGLASFVNATKDPQSYVDRYDNEENYKKWFDDNFAEYDSIYHAVGMDEPVQDKSGRDESVPVPASFVDATKDPQSYVDRYDNEENYKKWFDDNFTDYDSIYHAVGMEEPVQNESVPVPASFVDATKDPQSYVDRYNNEERYKKWFDDNFADYDSIYHAVGMEEPKIADTKEDKTVACGRGTEQIDGICTIIKKPVVVKPWWKFW